MSSERVPSGPETSVEAASSSERARLMIRFSRAAIVAGALVLIAGAAIGRAPATLGALLASWLFFAGLAAGGVAVSAALRVAQATWAARILPVAEASSAFLAPALAILVLLLGLARVWLPGLAEEGAGAWLSLVARNLVPAALLLLAARRYVAASRREAETTTRDAIVYLLVYVATLTIWAIDLVIGLHDSAPSTVIPPFYFMGAFLSAVAWSTLVTSTRPDPPPAGSRVDLAKILFGLSILWFYLLWSGFMPVWYANIPEETEQLLARWEGGFKPLTIAVVAAVFFLPFWILMPGSAKHRPRRVALGAASILTGLVGERFLLVLPSLGARGAWSFVAALAATAALLGAFLLTAGAELLVRARGAEKAPA